MEGTPGYFRQGGGLRDVSFCLRDVARQRLPLELLDCLRLARHEAQFGFKCDDILHVQRKVGGLNDRRGSQDHCPFNDVF